MLSYRFSRCMRGCKCKNVRRPVQCARKRHPIKSNRNNIADMANAWSGATGLVVVAKVIVRKSTSVCCVNVHSGRAMKPALQYRLIYPSDIRLLPSATIEQDEEIEEKYIIFRTNSNALYAHKSSNLNWISGCSWRRLRQFHTHPISKRTGRHQRPSKKLENQNWYFFLFTYSLFLSLSLSLSLPRSLSIIQLW